MYQKERKKTGLHNNGPEYGYKERLNSHDDNRSLRRRRPREEVSLRSGAADLRFASYVTGADLRRGRIFSLLDEGNVEFAFIALHGGGGRYAQAALEMAGDRSPAPTRRLRPCDGQDGEQGALSLRASPCRGDQVGERGVRDVLDDPHFPSSERSKPWSSPAVRGTVGVSILSGTDRLAEALEDAATIGCLWRVCLGEADGDRIEKGRSPLPAGHRDSARNWILRLQLITRREPNTRSAPLSEFVPAGWKRPPSPRTRRLGARRTAGSISGSTRRGSPQFSK